MGVAVLHPHDSLNQPFSHMKYPRNPNSCPKGQKKPISNRTRRSPPRNQTTRSPPPVAPPLPPPRPSSVPKGTVKKNQTNGAVVGQLRILKRGEDIPTKKITDPAVEIPDLVTKRQIVSDPVPIKTQIRLPNRKSKTVPLYAGPVTMTSPPPSDVPLPAFFTTKKSVSLFQAADATNDLIRILRLDIA